MSVPSSSRSYTAQFIRNGDEERETFHKFFECWLAEQSRHLEELVSISKQSQEERILRPKIARVIEHYEQYYRTKSMWAKHDVASMFNPSWLSNLEDAFLWVGGWWPSMAFHLLYSKSGLQFEAGLAELISGLKTGDLGDLSREQVNQVDELQKATIREEKDITEKLAKQQETVADPSMVELSHAVSESRRMAEGDDHDPEAADDERVEAVLAPKAEGMVEVLQMADDLRLKTLRNVVRILTPMQGVHFLIAAAELHLRLHEWGRKRDSRHPQHQQGGQVGHDQQNP